jgi:hypothetical protein
MKAILISLSLLFGGDEQQRSENALRKEAKQWARIECGDSVFYVRNRPGGFCQPAKIEIKPAQ